MPPHDPDAMATAVLDHLARTPEQAEAMTSAARQRVQAEFSIDRIAYQQQTLYTALDRARKK